MKRDAIGGFRSSEFCAYDFQVTVQPTQMFLERVGN
jgi:hypothetical protein